MATNENEVLEAAATQGASEAVQLGRLRIDQEAQEVQEEAKRHTLLETADAAFRRHNSVSSAYSAWSNGMFSDYDAEEGFDPYDLIDDTEYADDQRTSTRLGATTSRAEFEAVKNQIESEWQADKTISEQGIVGGALAMTAAIVDPATVLSMLLPGTQARSATRLGGFVRGALYGGTAELGVEGLLQATQQARTASESAINIGASTILGGFLGSIVDVIPEAELKALSSKMAGELGGFTPTGSVGAMARDQVASLDENTIAKGGRTIAKVMGGVSPSVRVMTSPSASARSAVENMVELTFKLDKNYEGTATAVPVETDIKRVVSVASSQYRMAKNGIYQEYRKAAAASGQKPMKLAEFNEEVAKAMRRDDKHSIPEVAKAAALNRQMIVDPSRERAIAAGMMESAVEVAERKELNRSLDEYTRAQTRQIYADYRADFASTVAKAERLRIRQDRRKKIIESSKMMRRQIRRSRKAGDADGEATARADHGKRVALIRAAATRQIKKVKRLSGPEFRKMAEKSADGLKPRVSNRFIDQASELLKKRRTGQLNSVVSPRKVDPEKLKGVKGAQSYLMRMYNVRQIKQDKIAWLRTIEDYLTSRGMDRLEAVSISQEVTRRITGSDLGMIDSNIMDGIVPKSGRLKGRTLDIPDAVLEPWLVNDIDTVTEAYLRSFVPEIAFTERFGTRDMADQINAIRDEYVALREDAKKAGNEKEVARLDRRERRDIEDIMAMRDRMYGTYGLPKDPSNFFVRAGRLLRVWNYVTKLGGQVISSVQDVGNMHLRYGTPKMVRTAMKLATSVEALKLSKSTAQKAGAALDLFNNSRAASLADIHQYSPYAEQRAAQKVANAFSIATLQSPWNTVMQAFSSVMSQDDILNAAITVSKGGKISKNETARFAQLGLDEQSFKEIAEQYQRHGQTKRGLKFGFSDEWDDPAIRSRFENAVLAEADASVILPGAGDTPLFMSTEWGKVLMQFKTFAIASVNRTVIPLAQGVAHGDIKAITTIPVLFALGGLVHALKRIQSGREIEDDPVAFAMEAFDWSGMMGWSNEVIYPAMMMAGIHPTDRFTTRGIWGMAGPTPGLIEDAAFGVAPATWSDGVNQSEFKRYLRLTPGGNITYMRPLLRQLEESFPEK